jgi:hypothetical protein
VKKHQICFICGKPDWCTYTSDMGKACCMRIQSDKPAKNGGYYHDIVRNAAPLPIERPDPRPTIDAPGYVASLGRGPIENLATALHVPVESLLALDARWDHNCGAWAFPMLDAEEIIIGIRIRHASGKKWAITGSRSGLFIPAALVGWGPLVIVEGPTDCAAIHGLGFDVVGRPSCAGGVDLIESYLRKLGRRDVVILSDKDEPKTRPDGTTWFPGQEGAAVLANAIAGLCRTLKVIYPLKGKDARAWIGSGATSETILAVIKNAHYYRRGEVA